ncbi:MAG: zf-TFIIB domain-containing protein [Candidatus Pacebacteria bacterium]|nr:zf-TFIIB domain-containing protein [Candidatus Paceibacterota bacterium]
MPELPDVAGFQAYFEDHAVGNTIEHVTVLDSRVLTDVTPQSLGKRLHNAQVTTTNRHGKYLFVGTSADNGWLVLHFGMTGYLEHYQENEDPPKQTNVIFTFTNGAHIAYVNQRRLGEVTWADTVATFVEARELGPDALSDTLSPRQFADRLAHHRGMLKSALMNQSIVAGMGNEWADETLFQCGLPPKTSLANLKPDDCEQIARTAQRILRTGMRARCKSRPLPKHYLNAHRHKDDKCPKCGTDLTTVKVAGRTTFYCPKCQQ